MKQYDFLIVGAGIFGITTAVELAKRKCKVCVINPDSIPHHLAASTDITKAVRMEYGSDEFYFDLAASCIPAWREWNEFFGTELYHEAGFLMLCRKALKSKAHQFEFESYKMLTEKGYTPERLDAKSISRLYPLINPDYYKEAIYNPIGGFAESGLVVSKLAEYAVSLGVDVLHNTSGVKLIYEGSKVVGVLTSRNEIIHAGHTILAAGANTSELLPELTEILKPTAHPVFWLKPQSADQLSTLPVFTADISNTGWYGFPISKKHGVFKIAKHAQGEFIDPSKDDRRVKDSEVIDMRNFLNMSFPDLSSSPLVYTRKCIYTDTADGHFLIDNHPGKDGLTVASGGSGHGFKFAPILGKIIADKAELKGSSEFDRFRWRKFSSFTKQDEQARFID